MIYSLSRACRGPQVKCSKCQQQLSFSTKISASEAIIVEHYRTLGLRSGSDQESVRKAFISLCKVYHPDSGGPHADSNKFHEIEKSYRALQTKFMNERWDVNGNIEEAGKKKNEEVKEYDIKHTAPQHREYLSWGGYGSGTPSQREQQYQQMRAVQAAQRVMTHKMGDMEDKGNALSVQDQRRVKKTKTGLGIDRLVEDKIQESMARGDFDNLSGAGKPLQRQSFNPHLDFITQKMNEILIENGFTPEWITLAREIEQDSAAIRQHILENIHHQNSAKWSQTMAGLQSSAQALNKKIQFFNLIVPILNKQQLLFMLDKEIEKAQKLAPPPGTSPMQSTVQTSCHTTQRDVNMFGLLSSIFRGS